MVMGFIVLAGVSATVTVVCLWMFRTQWIRGCNGIEFVQLLGGMAAGFSALFAGVVVQRYLLFQAGGDTGGFFVGMATVVTMAPAGLSLGAVFIEKTTNALSNAGMAMERYPLAPLGGVAQRARNGDVEGAIAECERCAGLYPKDPEPFFIGARIASGHERFEHAVRLLEKARLKHRGNARAFTRASLELSKLYDGPLNNPSEANRYRASIRSRDIKSPVKPRPSVRELATAPGHPMERARLLAQKGDVDRAVALYREIHKQKGGGPRPLFEAASLLEQHERYAESADIVRLILRSAAPEPEQWAEATMRLARLLDNFLGEPEAARDLWEKVNERMKHTAFGKEARERLHGSKPWHAPPQSPVS